MRTKFWVIAESRPSSSTRAPCRNSKDVDHAPDEEQEGKEADPYEENRSRVHHASVQGATGMPEIVLSR